MEWNWIVFHVLLEYKKEDEKIVKMFCFGIVILGQQQAINAVVGLVYDGGRRGCSLSLTPHLPRV